MALDTNITIANVVEMPDSDKARARSLDARTFSNQPSRQLTAEEIKKKLAIPTEILILESKRLVTAINASLADIQSQLNATNSGVNAVETNANLEIGDINTFLDEVDNRLMEVENNLPINLSNLETTLRGVIDEKDTATNERVTVLVTKVDNHKLALDNAISDLVSDLKALDDNLTALESKHDGEISGISNTVSILGGRIDALVNGTTTDLDTLKEVIDMVNSADTSILSQLATKLNVTDVVDNLTSYLTEKPLSANQGRILNEHFTNVTNALDTDLDNKIAEVYTALDTQVDRIEENLVSLRSRATALETTDTEIRESIVDLYSNVGTLTTNQTSLTSRVGVISPKVDKNITDIEIANKHIADLNEMLKGYVYDSTEVVGSPIPSTVEVSSTTYNVLDGAKGVVSKVEGDTNNLDGVLYSTEYSGVKVSSPNLTDNSLIIGKGGHTTAQFIDDKIVNNVTSDPREFNYNYSDIKVYLQKGTYTFVMFVDKPSQKSASAVNIFTEIATGTAIVNMPLASNFVGVKNATFTLDQDVNVGIVIKSYQATFNFMLVKGSTPPTTFVPYHSKTVLPYPTTLNGVGDYKDTLEIRENASGLYDLVKVKKCEIFNLTSNTSFTRVEVNNGKFRFHTQILPFLKVVTSNDNPQFFIHSSNSLSTVSPNALYNGVQGIGLFDGKYVGIVVDGVTTLTSISDYLSANPIDILYPLLTPTEEVIVQNLTIDEISAKYNIGGSVEVQNASSIYLNKPKTTSTIVYKKFGA